MEDTIVKREIGLFIINNDTSISNALRNFLQIRFGELLTISIFSSGEEALAAIDQKTEIIVLENYLKGETDTAIRNSIKNKNRFIEVIRLGTNDEMTDVIESYTRGNTKSFHFKPGNRTMFTPVFKTFTYPGRKLAKEFNINEILAITI